MKEFGTNTLKLRNKMAHQNQDRIRNVGKHTYGQHNIEVYYWGEGTWLDIGNFCSISGHINVYLGGNHRTDWATTYPFGHINQGIFINFNGAGHPQTKGNVTIGNDVCVYPNLSVNKNIVDNELVKNNI